MYKRSYLNTSVFFLKLKASVPSMLQNKIWYNYDLVFKFGMILTQINIFDFMFELSRGLVPGCDKGS